MKKIVLICCLMAASQQGMAQRYVFFLHNMFLELYDTSVAHPEYGKVQYARILATFRKEGFTVISEIRPKGTDGQQYARKVARQVDSLLARGVKPGNITVVGTSKGSYIAQYASTYVHNKKVNYVFIGCCGRNDPASEPDIKYCGNILSVFERSDSIGQSVMPIMERSKDGISAFKEIELHTGLKHGYLYQAHPGWLQPAIKWAKQDYE